MTSRRLIIFDVDGTLVDSQSEINAAMDLAHQTLDIETPQRDLIRSIVGLSLPEAFVILHPEKPRSVQAALGDAYRQAYFQLRTAPNATEAVFFEGIRELLDDLRTHANCVLAVATGKSRRGLDRLIKHHDLIGYFASTQVSDDHPSKPDPSMIHAAISECGVDAQATVMIGDTTYDIDMARAAGVRSIGVDWGYHDTQDMNADAVAWTVPELRNLLQMDLSR